MPKARNQLIIDSLKALGGETDKRKLFTHINDRGNSYFGMPYAELRARIVRNPKLFETEGDIVRLREWN